MRVSEDRGIAGAGGSAGAPPPPFPEWVRRVEPDADEAKAAAMLSAPGGLPPAAAQSVSTHLLGGSCTGCTAGSSEGEGLLLTMGRLLNPNYEVTVSYRGTSNVTLRGPYAGVLGWPAQCGGPMRRCWPAMDKVNLAIVLDGYHQRQ